MLRPYAGSSELVRCSQARSPSARPPRRSRAATAAIATREHHAITRADTAGPATGATRGGRDAVIAKRPRPTTRSDTAATCTSWEPSAAGPAARRRGGSARRCSRAPRAAGPPPRPEERAPPFPAARSSPERPNWRRNTTVPSAKTPKRSAPRSCTSEPKRMEPSTWAMPAASPRAAATSPPTPASSRRRELTPHGPASEGPPLLDPPGEGLPELARTDAEDARVTWESAPRVV